MPLRLEVGPREVGAGQLRLADRLSRAKRPLPAQGVGQAVQEELEGFQRRLYERALEFREQNTFEVSTLSELVAHFKERNGFVWAPWCGSTECEARVKEETGGVSTRNFPPDEKPAGECLVCGRKAEHRVVFARAY